LKSEGRFFASEEKKKSFEQLVSSSVSAVEPEIVLGEGTEREESDRSSQSSEESAKQTFELLNKLVWSEDPSEEPEVPEEPTETRSTLETADFSYYFRKTEGSSEEMDPKSASDMIHQMETLMKKVKELEVRQKIKTEKMEVEGKDGKPVNEGRIPEELKPKFKFAKDAAESRKDYRTVHEIETLYQLAAARSDDERDVIVAERLKQIAIAMEFGWGALDEKKKQLGALFDIKEEDLPKLEEAGKESKAKYMDKVNRRKARGEFRQSAMVMGGGGGSGKNRQNSSCFICKQYGHWAPECPNKK
jgi:hypothetical protein